MEWVRWLALAANASACLYYIVLILRYNRHWARVEAHVAANDASLRTAREALDRGQEAVAAMQKLVATAASAIALCAVLEADSNTPEPVRIAARAALANDPELLRSPPSRPERVH